MKVKQPRKDLLILEEMPGKFTYFLAVIVLSFLLAGLHKWQMQNYDEFRGLTIISAGLFIVLLIVYRRGRYEFDSAKGKFTWKRSGLFRTRGWSVPLLDIENAIVRSDRDIDGPARYVVFVITNKGQMPFNVYGTNEKQIRVTYASVTHDEAENIVNLIRTILHKQEIDLSRDGFHELVAAGDQMGAVRLIREEDGPGLTEAVERVRDVSPALKQ